jgi:quinol monooxygenase YgiN
MTSLDPTEKYFLVINTFNVEPEHADHLLKDLIDLTEKDVSKRPGFVSANFHIAADRTAVINYAQWRSKGDADAMLDDPEGQAGMRQATARATKVSPVFVDLIWTSTALG